jgi:methionyl aminopeptidase
MLCCRPLREGDIVNVDVTAYLNGHHGDTNAMFFVGAWWRLLSVW